MERALAGRGVPRTADEPLTDWLERATRALGREDLQRRLQDVLRLHYQYRFDPPGLSAAERAALREKVHTCLPLLDQAAGTSSSEG